jgi:hypothetical protein
MLGIGRVLMQSLVSGFILVVAFVAVGVLAALLAMRLLAATRGTAARPAARRESRDA